MEIKVLGDFEMAREILLGVTRLFSNPNGALISDAPKALLAGFLIWSFLKWALDNEKAPYPAKEFVFGIAFWLIFGGGDISPKYTVELTSIRENRFQVIDDVPFLAAVPSWIASNFFGEARAILEDNFSPLQYGTSSDERTPDPLSTLVKLYDNGSALLIDPYLSKSISTYIVDCYEVEQQLDGTPLALTRSELDAMPINRVWNGVKVTYNFLTAKYYTELDKTGTLTSCNTIWTNINNIVTVETSDFSKRLVNINASKGMTTEAISSASKMIYAASTYTSPSPIEIQQGLFLSYMMRDGLSKTSIETWSDKMMFEAQRKRVIENAGERNMFMQVMIPIITVIETFSFFIAPVMMVLSVLGGHGLALIIKYLMLVLFVNLWGFVKVFVDLFTAMSVERAFKAVEMGDPFAFGAYGQTFNEIEGFLSVAASMTVAIPMFAMFLLYGGVHSVMGVMRTLGGGSVDGNMVAPTMSSSMNGGVYSMGDTTTTQMTGSGQFATSHNVSTDASLGSGTVSAAMSGATSNTSSTARNQVQSNVSSWNQTAATAFSAQNAVSHNESGGKNIDFSKLSATQQMAALAHKLEESGVVQEGQGGQAVADIVAGGGLAVGISGGLGNAVNGFATRFGLDAKASAAVKAGWSEDKRKQHAELVAQVENWSKNDAFTTAGKDGISYTNMDSNSKSGTEDKSTSQVSSASQQVNRSVTQAAAAGDEISRQDGINNTQTLSFNALDGVVKGNTHNALEQMYRGFDQKTLARLNGLGIGDADSLMQRTEGETKNGRSFAANLQELDKVVGGADKDLNESSKDHRIISQAYTFAGGLMSQDPHASGFLAAGKANLAIAERIEAANTIKEGINAPDVSKVPTPSQVGTESSSIKGETEGRINSAPSGEKQKQEVINAGNDASRQAIFNGDGSVQNTVPGKPDEVAKKLQESKQLIGRTDEIFNSELGQGMLQAVKSAAGTAQDWFGSTGRLWGVDSESRAERMNSHFIQNDSFSVPAKQGFDALLSNGTPEVMDAFMRNALSRTGTGPNAEAYAMNDAVMLMQTPHGRELFKNLPEGEDKDRFSASIAKFTALKNELSPEEQAQMDAISKHRISGALPSEAADILIRSAAQGDERKPIMEYPNVAGQAVGQLIANTAALDKDSTIRSMAGYSDDDLITNLPGNGKAMEMITNDEKARIKSSGAYNFDSNVVNGVNRNWSDEQLQKGVDTAINGGRDGVVAGIWEAMVGKDGEQAPGNAAIFNAGLGGLATRLENAGFTAESAAVERQVLANQALVAEYGAVNSVERQKMMSAAGEAVINGRDTSELKELAPSVLKDLQILSQEDGQRKQFMAPDNVGPLRTGTSAQLLPATQYSTAVAESGDGRVLFSGKAGYEPQSNSDYAINIASNYADKDALENVKVVAIHDTFMNRAFMNSLESNNNQAPATFTSESQQTYNLMGTDSNGVSTYDGGSNGRFTYTPGDDRLMPTRDNQNYIPTDMVEKSSYTDGSGSKISLIKDNVSIPDDKK